MQAHENLYIQSVAVTTVVPKRGAQLRIGDATADGFGDADREAAVSQRLLKIAGRELQLRKRRQRGALKLPASLFLEDCRGLAQAIPRPVAIAQLEVRVRGMGY